MPRSNIAHYIAAVRARVAELEKLYPSKEDAERDGFEILMEAIEEVVPEEFWEQVQEALCNEA